METIYKYYNKCIPTGEGLRLQQRCRQRCKVPDWSWRTDWRYPGPRWRAGIAVLMPNLSRDDYIDTTSKSWRSPSPAKRKQKWVVCRLSTLLYCRFSSLPRIYSTKSCFLLMQISYPYIVWKNVPKFHENRASSFLSYAPKCARNCGVTIVWDTTLGAGAHKLYRYPFRKMRKLLGQYTF